MVGIIEILFHVFAIARQIACLSNSIQLGLAFVQYISTSGGYYQIKHANSA